MHRAHLIAATLAVALAAIGGGIAAGPATAAAQAQAARAPAAASSSGDRSLVNGKEIAWGETPPCFLPGAKLAVIQGNPFAPTGEWAVRLSFPDGYVVDPHWHPTDENVTVLSGTLLAGMGNSFDESKMTAYEKGGFFIARAKEPHYVKARGRTEVQLHGLAPLALHYVSNPHGTLPNCE